MSMRICGPSFTQNPHVMRIDNDSIPNHVYGYDDFMNLIYGLLDHNPDAMKRGIHIDLKNHVVE